MSPRFTSFERGVLKAVMVIGTLRAVLELSLDNLPETGYTDFYMDIAALVLFVFGLSLILRNGADVLIRWAFFVPLLVLICLGIYFYGGLSGSVELIVYGLAVVINLTMRKRTLLFFNIFLIASTAITFYFVERVQPVDSFSVSDDNPITFVFISLGIIVLTNIGKNSFEEKRNELVRLNSNLARKQKELEDGNKELTDQNEKLRALRSELKKKVKERTRMLQQQNESIEAYMKLTLVELIQPYEKTLKEIGKVRAEDNISKMLIDSGNRLKYEVEHLTKRLKGGSDD